MEKQIFRAIIVVSFLAFSIAFGDTFTVPLNVNGYYSSGQSQNIEFDLGIPLVQINNAVFSCQGSMTAGLSYYYTPIGDHFACYLHADSGSMLATGPTRGVSTYPLPEIFSDQSAFSSLIGGNWNFLLDGHASGYVNLPSIVSIPEAPPRSYPHGTLNSSSIIINAIPAYLASYEPCETRLSVTTDSSKDPTLTAQRVIGNLGDIPKPTDGNYLLELQWTNETDGKVEVKHTWTNFTFDLSDKQWLLADVYFANPSSVPAAIGLWDDTFGWLPPTCVPNTDNEWHTLLFYVGNLDYNNLGNIDAFVFDGLPASAGTIYIDNLRFGSPNDISPSSISFSKYNWWLKDTGCGQAGPGNNFFSDSNQNIWVDTDGRLHLKIAHRSGNWYCSEIINQESLGYGTHVFTTEGRIDLLDPNAVLGLFTWDTNAPQYNYREIDFEFSRWSDSAEINNSQYVVQPWDTPGNRLRFPVNIESNDIITSQFEWLPDKIIFKTYFGEYPLSNPDNLIESWTYTGADIPPAGGENDRINLWLLAPPSDGNDIELVVKSFKYLPLGDLNKDGYFDSFDISIFAQAWLSLEGQSQWNSDCDAYPHDGFIDFKDFTFFAPYWNRGRGL